MKILNENNLPLKEKTACTIGTFDGVHKAHQRIIEELKRDKNLKSLVITFEPPPKIYLSKAKCLITDFETKLYILNNLNIDFLYLINFNDNFLKIRAEEFLKFLVFKLNCKSIVVGYDWKFGYRKEGNITYLEKMKNIYNFQLKVINPIVEKNVRVSSTKIRELLANGQVDKVKDLLGRDYFIRGKVVEGNKLGRKLGFPTLNLDVKENLCLKKGVYAGLVEYKNSFYKAVINFGVRPTIDGSKPLIEAHILKKTINIYNEKVNIYFLNFLREEKKFPSVDKLVKQIKLDIIKAKNILNS